MTSKILWIEPFLVRLLDRLCKWVKSASFYPLLDVHTALNAKSSCKKKMLVVDTKNR